MIVLGVLAVVWVVALTPMVLRHLSERQLSSSVRSYHRRLLRLGSSSTVQAAPVGSSVPGAMLGYSAAAQRLHGERFGTQVLDAPAAAEPSESLSVSVSAGASPATAARRRQVVTVLVGATAAFFLLGMIPAVRIMWDLALLTLGCTAAYVALLIHFHRLAVERAQKVIALETRRHVSAALESRRHVIAVDRARHVAVGGSYSPGSYSPDTYSPDTYSPDTYSPDAYAADTYSADSYSPDRYAADRYAAGYANAGSSYARVSGPALSGSGWSVTGVHRQRATTR
jgi:hypothetical protein